MAEVKRKRMTKQDKEDWDVLYQYVRCNVLGYDQNQSLSSTMVLRLKGLLYNKFMENLSQEDTANYSYRTVLNTFKFCMPDIQKGLRSNTFKDESHRFNYVLKIVEGKINDVYMRERNAAKVKEEIKTFDTTLFEHKGAEYKSQTKINDAFANMWNTEV